MPSHLYLRRKVILLEHEVPEGVSAARAGLFAAKAQRAVGLRGEVNIRITSSRELQELNRRFRRQERADRRSVVPVCQPQSWPATSPSQSRLPRPMPPNWATPPKTELKILILHGLLHLAGYDHETDDGEMRTRETTLRRQLGLPVGLIERAHGNPLKSSPGRKQSRKSADSSKSRRRPEMSLPLSILLLVLMALLALVSYVDRLYAEMGKFLGREFQENIDAYEQHVEPRLHVSRERAALSMAVLTQMCMASIGVLIGYVLFMEKRWVVLDLVQAAVSLIFIIVIFNRLLPYVFFVRTRGEWLVRLGPGFADADLSCRAGDADSRLRACRSHRSPRSMPDSSLSIRRRPWTR